MLSYGNKVVLIQKVLDLVVWIEDNQNSPEVVPFKRILVKMAGTMTNVFDAAADSMEKERLGNEKQLDPVIPMCDSECSVCPSNDSHVPVTDKLVPEFDIDLTIKKIREEIGNESKN